MKRKSAKAKRRVKGRIKGNPNTIAQLILADARARGLRHFFGIPGGGAPLDLLDAGRRLGVDFVHINHESSAAIAAAGYGLMKNTTGLALAIKGVGMGNLVGGIANAYFERWPLLAVCECSSSAVHRRELVQHCDHQALVGGITKFFATLEASRAPSLLREAVLLATDGRPGPVLLDLPSDLGAARCREGLPLRAPRKAVVPDNARIAAARKLLENARHPLVIAGADVIRGGALRELMDLVESTEAAVLVTMEARGVFPETHPRWAGVFVGSYTPHIVETEIAAQADLIILIGVDAMMTHTPWQFRHPTVEFVARPGYETLSPNPKVRVDGDIQASLRGIALRRQSGFSQAEVEASRLKIQRYFSRPGGSRLAAQDIIQIARGVLPLDGILFSETGAYIRILETLWAVDRPGTYVGTSGGRSMGLTVPAVLGAKLACPEVPMVGIGGDGSLLMRLGELEAFARMRVKVPLVIINDQALGTMKSRQKSRGMPDYALDLHPVDFAAVAAACGLRGVTVDTPEAFEAELRLAMDADRATLIDARVDPKFYQDGFGPTIGIISQPRARVPRTRRSLSKKL